MSDVRPVDPGSIPEKLGEETGRAMAAKLGDEYENIEGRVPQQNQPVKPATNGVKSNKLEIPGVGVVELGAPGGATALTICKILGPEQGTNMMLHGYLKGLLYVRKLNGQELAPIMTWEAAQALATQLGDQGVDAVLLKYSELWPPLKVRDLPLSGA